MQKIPDWLIEPTEGLLAAWRKDRLPHALLFHDVAGAGGDWLAGWTAKLALCTQLAEAPCGHCAACVRVESRHHPDLTVIQPVEDSQQIRIEQIRDLGAELALTSHQGGYKVAMISPADALNRFAANALLKTLEEPAPRTLLILVASHPSRLPATILSRCQRIRIHPPARAAARAWLEAERGTADWNSVLDTLGNAPFRAAQADAMAVAALATETQRTLTELQSGSADAVSTAERWSRSEPALRLRCLENWLTERIRAHFGARPTDVTERDAVLLPRSAPVPNIRGLFELVDDARDLRSALETPINKSLAFEALLRRLAPHPRSVGPERERR